MGNYFPPQWENFLIKTRMSSESLNTVVQKDVCHSTDNKYTKDDLMLGPSSSVLWPRNLMSWKTHCVEQGGQAISDYT